MITSSEALKRARTFLKDQQRVDFGVVLEAAFGVSVADARPVQKAMLEADLHDRGSAPRSAQHRLATLMTGFWKLAEAAAKFAACEVAVDLAEHEALETAAQMVEARAKNLTGVPHPGIWPPLAESTLRKKDGVNSPLLETGEMRSSIEHQVVFPVAYVGSDNDKAVIHEFGVSVQWAGVFVELDGEEIASLVENIVATIWNSPRRGRRLRRPDVALGRKLLPSDTLILSNIVFDSWSTPERMPREREFDIRRFPQLVTYDVSCLVTQNSMAGNLGAQPSTTTQLVSADLATAMSLAGL